MFERSVLEVILCTFLKQISIRLTKLYYTLLAFEFRENIKS